MLGSLGWPGLYWGILCLGARIVPQMEWGWALSPVQRVGMGRCSGTFPSWRVGQVESMMSWVQGSEVSLWRSNALSADEQALQG